jgi:hypothetical protein
MPGSRLVREVMGSKPGSGSGTYTTFKSVPQDQKMLLRAMGYIGEKGEFKIPFWKSQEQKLA